MKGLEKLYNTDCMKVFRFAKKYLLLCVLYPSVIFHSYFLLHYFPVCWLSPSLPTHHTIPMVSFATFPSEISTVECCCQISLNDSNFRGLYPLGQLGQGCIIDMLGGWCLVSTLRHSILGIPCHGVAIPILRRN